MAAKRIANLQFQLEKAAAKREIYFTELENLYKLSQNCNDCRSRASFTALFRLHEERWTKLLKAIDQENDLKFQISSDFSPDYSILKEAEKYRVAILDTNAMLEGKPQSASSHSTINLPEIALPEFYGGALEWPLFFGKFCALIHNNPNLDDLSRMHYLLSALKGEALKAVDGLVASAENYHLLLNTLKVKFEDKRLLAHTYVRQMLDAKPLLEESGEELLTFLTRFDASFKSFTNLKIERGLEYVIGNVLLTKIDPQTRRHFETSKQKEPIPLYEDLFEFFVSHARDLIHLSQTYKKSKPFKTPSQIENSRFRNNAPKALITNVTAEQVAHSNLTGSKSASCPTCDESHPIFKCSVFHKLTIENRIQVTREKQLCENCLGRFHSSQFCKSTARCRYCGRAHHTLLHLNSLEESQSKAKTDSESSETDNPTTYNFFNNSPIIRSARQKLTLLPTAVAIVETPFGRKTARFLLDSGSQSHFITLKGCKRLNLKYWRKKIPLEGMGKTQLEAVGQSSFIIRSIHDHKFKLKIDALVTDTITDQLPQDSVDVQDLEFVQSLPLADKYFYRPNHIDGILGASLFGKLLCNYAISNSEQNLQALKTKLGFIIIGEANRSFASYYSTERNLPTTNPPSHFCIFHNTQLTNAVQRFWELEEIPKKPKLTNEELRCEQVFLTTTSRLSDGRYSVHLPFKEFPPGLGESRAMAERRWLSLERRFKKNPELKKQYSTVIQDYLAQKHLSLAAVPNKPRTFINYIPHFSVVRESPSTPLRVVFDASAKTSNGRALNDALFTGPKLQKDISSILTLFRHSPVVLVADIRQMYRNIAVANSHRPFQSILWRESPEEPLQTYQLNCVMFGLTSAPYLALRTVHQLVQDEKNNFPLAARIVDRHMYVDDLVVSLESVPEALEAHRQLVGLFKAGGFHLTKWVSNSSEVLRNIPLTDCHPRSINFEDSSQVIPIVKVLGLKWDANSDSFTFATHSFPPTFSKRGILSTIARIWDPLGFLAPVTLLAKLILKDLWASGIDWDEPLPPAIHCQWQRFVADIPTLQEVQVPRHFRIASTTPVFLVGFADSSEKGYGAVVYLRSQAPRPTVNLLCAKSRVAPQKTISLPRLELCAAVLLSQLMEFCMATVFPPFQVSAKFALTDSTVTLCWIKNTDCKRDTFVSHRISAIDRILRPSEWYHVRSSDNMADCISRGLSPGQFLQQQNWFDGPSWLTLDPSQWPIQQEVIQETRSSPQVTASGTRVLTVTSPDPSPLPPITALINRSSSWIKLCRITVYVLRFGGKLPSRNLILASDLTTAEISLIRVVQQEHFRQDFALLTKNQPPSHALRRLRPFIQEGCLRVGGRLDNAPISYNHKHPLLLPKKSHLVNLIIDYYHKIYQHAGPNLLLALLRQRFWILSARNIVRQRIHQCNRCFKVSPKNTVPLMGCLPSARVTPEKPFAHCGVDYAGPFSITMHRRRGSKTQKGYICLFVCFITKALHLELASDLSTDAFLLCFTRFISRRGPVSVMYSDCGTNFVGAKTKFEAHHELIKTRTFQQAWGEKLAQHHIEWKLNPPAAPHFGGLWEANVKSVKTHIYKAVGTQVLSWEEFTTLLTQIESILNSRPLTRLSNDPAEPEALTPAHFLNGTPLQSIPFTSFESIDMPLNARKQLLDQMIQSFWKRWRLEYLSSLQPRGRWDSPTTPLAVGTVVLVRDDTAPPLRWPLGVIEKIHPGTDGIVRVVTVRIKKSLFLRPVIKLFPLPSQ